MHTHTPCTPPAHTHTLRTSRARSCNRMDVSAHSRLASCVGEKCCKPTEAAAAAAADAKPGLRWWVRAKEAAKEEIACVRACVYVCVLCLQCVCVLCLQ